MLPAFRKAMFAVSISILSVEVTPSDSAGSDIGVAHFWLTSLPAFRKVIFLVSIGTLSVDVVEAVPADWTGLGIGVAI